MQTRRIQLGVLVIAVVFALCWVAVNAVLPVRAADEDEKAMRFHRTALIASGQSEEAMKFAIGVAEYLNKKYPDTTVRTYMESFGDFGRVHWFADHESMASMEKRGDQLVADEGYQTMVTKAAPLFVEGSMKDKLYRAIP